MTRAEDERVRVGEVAWTVAIRTDLSIDVDSEGRVLGVERVGDDVRFRDLLDVIEALVLPEDEGE